MVDISGPINIEQGNSATFNLEFLSSTGDLTVPSTANLTVTYTTNVTGTATDTVNLSLIGSFWTGTWSSTSANLCVATWMATSGGSTAVATGTLRIIQRQSSY